MYTQCPHCQTCFRIAEAHLKAAKGKVRCGSCKQIFVATDHLYKQMPETSSARTQPPARPATATAPPHTGKTAPVAKPPAEPQSPPLSGIHAAFAEEEHEHIDLGLGSDPIPAQKPQSLTDRRNMPDQSPFMESLIGENSRYNNLDEMGSISIPGETQLSDSFIRFMNDEDEDDTADSQTVTSDPPQTAEEADDTLDNIRAQLSAFDNDLGLKDTATATHPYADKQDDPPANTQERDAISDMYGDIENQLESPMLKVDPDKLNRDINALLDDAMALDSRSASKKPSPADDLVDDALKDEDETLARFEAELENMKLEPQMDDNASIFDIQQDELVDRSSAADAHRQDDFDLSDFSDLPPVTATADGPTKHNMAADNKEPARPAQDTAPQKTDQARAKPAKPPTVSPAATATAVDQADADPLDELPSLDNDIPKALRSSFEHFERPGRPLWLSVTLGLGIAVLLLGLLVQVAFFRSYELANRFPSLVPALTQLCQTLPCRYSGQRDVSQIEVISRNVSSHPTQKNALLISTAFVNRASFEQPYPIIAIRLSDLAGETVATRYFKPQDYLDSMYNPFLLMESGTPVHITLAVLDPGNDAVNFEFSFL